jgi:hypothetical protein
VETPLDTATAAAAPLLCRCRSAAAPLRRSAVPLPERQMDVMGTRPRRRRNIQSVTFANTQKNGHQKKAIEKNTYQKNLKNLIHDRAENNMHSSPVQGVPNGSEGRACGLNTYHKSMG